MPDANPTAEDPLEKARVIQQIYFNGFQIGISNADVGILGLLDNQPIVKLNVSYTVAKTLVVKLGQLVTQLEKATGREIMTTDDVGKGLEGASKG